MMKASHDRLSGLDEKKREDIGAKDAYVVSRQPGKLAREPEPSPEPERNIDRVYHGR